MVELFRAKWCEDLEELMKCPVCFERLKEPIAQCERGHQICTPCKNQLRYERPCPFCDATYTNTRNYLAENLSEKLDEIKLSLLDPEHSVNRKILHTVGLQTDGSVVVEGDAKRPRRAPPLAPKGKFPCRLGACELQLPHGRMISHIRYFHNTKFYESSTNGADSYNQVWEMDYHQKANFDLAIRIAELGLFFMRIKIDPIGNLFGVVQIVSSATIGKEFEYELKVGNGRRNVSFKDVLRSCRSNPTYLFESSDCLVVRHEDMELMTAANDDAFTCTMILTRLEKENRPQPQASGGVIIF